MENINGKSKQRENRLVHLHA